MLTPTQVALLQQLNSSTAERKVLTRWAFEHLHLYFYVKLVTIYTDHKACPQFLLMSEVLVTANGRIHNWRNRTAS